MFSHVLRISSINVFSVYWRLDVVCIWWIHFFWINSFIPVEFFYVFLYFHVTVTLFCASGVRSHVTSQHVHTKKHASRRGTTLMKHLHLTSDLSWFLMAARWMLGMSLKWDQADRTPLILLDYNLCEKGPTMRPGWRKTSHSWTFLTTSEDYIIIDDWCSLIRPFELKYKWNLKAWLLQEGSTWWETLTTSSPATCVEATWSNQPPSPSACTPVSQMLPFPHNGLGSHPVITSMNSVACKHLKADFSLPTFIESFLLTKHLLCTKVSWPSQIPP